MGGEHAGQPVAEMASLMDGRGQGCMGSFVGVASLLASVKGRGWQ